MEVASVTGCEVKSQKPFMQKQKEKARSEQVECHTLGSAGLSFHLLLVAQRHPGVQTSQNLRFPNKDRVHSY